jgi:hypothetical protein
VKDVLFVAMAFAASLFVVSDPTHSRMPYHTVAGGQSMHASAMLLTT